MPSLSCAGVSCPAGSTDTHHRSSHAPQAYPRAVPGHDRPPTALDHRRAWPGIEPRLLLPRLLKTARTRRNPRCLPRARRLPAARRCRRTAGRGRAVRTARPGRRGIPARGQAAHRARQRPSLRRRRGGRQRRRGRTGFGQGPVAAAAPAAPGARRAAAGRGDGRADRAYVYVSDPRAAARGRKPRWPKSTPTFLDGLAVSVSTVRTGLRRRRGDRRGARASTAARPSQPTNHRARSKRASAGLPTLVSNVETLANLPFLQRHGARRLPRTRHLDIARYVPGDHHRRRAAGRPLRDSARRGVHRTA